MDRMSPQGAMFISVEDERNPMHIGTVSLSEAPHPAGLVWWGAPAPPGR